jgi:hypothetical protein
MGALNVLLLVDGQLAGKNWTQAGRHWQTGYYIEVNGE